MNKIGNHTAISETSTLLVLRHRNNSVGIVQEVNQYGNLTDVLPDRDTSDTIIRVESSEDSFLNFYADFYNQLKNPAEYSFFKVREYEARETAIDLQKYVEVSSDKERKDLEKYAVSIETVETFRNKKYDREASAVNNDFKDDSSVLRSNFKYRYQIEDVPWERLAEIGLDRKKLESMGVLESLLKGYKTAMLIPILLRNGNSINTVDARLQLRLDNRGEVVVRIHRVQDKPDFVKMFGGHRFSKEDNKTYFRTQL
ncbi:DUF4099 domain-containing protein [Chryseobacterium scophthalmum]|uniref:DUF4099 domain-containing protein n=1 Tax=Chryseobacterium scophthalmum TaxID=59733 RepID=UPI001AEC3933|nr:DUF4099 domain-containing protein [Chryseobacterium scophthalmum]